MASTTIQNTIQTQDGTYFQSLFYLSLIPSPASTNQFQPSGALYGYITSFQFQLSTTMTVGTSVCNTIATLTTLSYNSFTWTTLLNAFANSTNPFYFVIIPIRVNVSLNSSSDSTVGLSWNVGDVDTGQVTDTLSFSPGEYSQSSVTVPQLTIQYDSTTDDYIVVQNGTYDLTVASFLPFSQLSDMITAVAGKSLSGTGLRGSLTLKKKTGNSPTAYCLCNSDDSYSGYQAQNNPTVLLSNADLSTPLLFQNTTYSESQGVIFLDNGLYAKAYCNCLPKFNNGDRVFLVQKTRSNATTYKEQVGPMFFTTKSNRCWGGQCCKTFFCGEKENANCCIGPTINPSQIMKPCPTSFFPCLIPVGSITVRSNIRQQASFYEQIGNPGQYLKNITTIPGKNFKRDLIQTQDNASLNGSINTNPVNSFCGSVLMQFVSSNPNVNNQYFSSTCQVYMVYYTKSTTSVTTLQYVSNTGVVTRTWGTYQYCQPLSTTTCTDLEVNLDVTVNSTTTSLLLLFIIEDMPVKTSITCNTNSGVYVATASSPYTVGFGNIYTFFNSVYGCGVYFTSDFTDSITFAYNGGSMNVTFPDQQYDAMNFNVSGSIYGEIIALGYPPVDSYPEFTMLVTSNLYQYQTFFVAFVDTNFNSLVCLLTPNSDGQCEAQLEYSSQSGWTWPSLYPSPTVLIQDSVTLLYLSNDCNNTTNPTGVCLTSFQGENNVWFLEPSSNSVYGVLPYDTSSSICLSAYTENGNGCAAQAPCFLNGDQTNQECLWSLSLVPTSGNPVTTSFQAQCGGEFQGQYMSASTCSSSFPAPCMGGDEYNWIVTPVVLFS
jgi:hypothetical protein